MKKFILDSLVNLSSSASSLLSITPTKIGFNIASVFPEALPRILQYAEVDDTLIKINKTTYDAEIIDIETIDYCNCLFNEALERQILETEDYLATTLFQSSI